MEIRRLILMFLALLAGCSLDAPTPTAPQPTATSTPPPDRESLIPAGQAKITPGTDLHPPRSESPEYGDPVPLPYPVNTAGAEDSAFIMPDGQTLYVWFTPVPNTAPEEQLFDGVTGIYMFQRQGEGWSAPDRVLLQDPGKLALDGCEFVLGDVMWFCSAREGYTGVNWFTASWTGGRWQNWTAAGFNPEYEVGELHISADGRELYFHSPRPGGLGEFDIWMSTREGGAWGPPINVTIVNSEFSDGWPFVTQDGQELWFTRLRGAPELYRSLRVDGKWGEPELMFTSLAGESSMDAAGNVYFTHHFFENDVMLEADIYMASPLKP